MKFDLTLIKKHPWASTAIIIVGGLIVYFLFFRGSSSGSQVATGGAPSDVDLAAQREAQNQQFQLSYLQAQQGGQFAIAQLQAQTSTTQQVNAIQGQLAIQGQQISSQEELAKEQIDAQKYLEELRANYSLQSQMVAQTGAYQIAQLTTQANIAINSANVDLQKSIANYQTQALTQIARYQVQQKESSDTLGAVVSLAGIAASFFSDRRLKSNIKRVGTHVTGIGIYEFNIGDKRQRGLMADEVLKVMPEAVAVDIDTGYLTVDYSKIAA